MSRTHLTVLALLCVATPFSADATARFVPLPGLPGYLDVTAAFDISGDGAVVVGRDARSGSHWQAAVWPSESSIFGLWFLGSSPRSRAFGVSEDGSVVVGETSTETSSNIAFRWTESGGMVPLGTLPGATSSVARGVSADGSIVIGTSGQGFVWTAATGMVGLGEDTSPSDMSADGAVIVGSIGIAPQQAVYWLDGGATLVPLGDPPPANGRTRAEGVSADSTVIVGFSSIDDFPEAVKWTAEDGLVVLPDLPGSSLARAASGDGTIIVGDGSNASVALMWDPVHGARRIADVLQNDHGIDLAGWRLRVATAVSDDGRKIVGYADDSEFYERAWLVELGACNDGQDNDGDGAPDHLDPACSSGVPAAPDLDAAIENPECQDGLNNDGDGLIDYDGGQSIFGACANGTCPPGVSDPDADGVADPDPHCANKPWRNDERKPKSCGLGAELLAALPLLRAIAARRRLDARD